MYVVRYSKFSKQNLLQISVILPLDLLCKSFSFNGSLTNYFCKNLGQILVDCSLAIFSSMHLEILSFDSANNASDELFNDSMILCIYQYLQEYSSLLR